MSDQIPEKSRNFIAKIDDLIDALENAIDTNPAQGVCQALEEYKKVITEVRVDALSKASLVPFDELIGNDFDRKEVFHRDADIDRIVKRKELDQLLDKLELLGKFRVLGFEPLSFTVFSKDSKQLSQHIVEYYESISIFLQSFRNNSKTVRVNTKRTRLNKDGRLRRELIKRLKPFADHRNPDSGLVDHASIKEKEDKKKFWEVEWEFPIRNTDKAPLVAGHWLSCFVNTTLISHLKANLPEDQFETLALFELKGAPEYGIGTIEFDVLAMINAQAPRIICIECKTGNLERVLNDELQKSVSRRDILNKIITDLQIPDMILDFYFVAPPPLTNNQKKAFKRAKEEFESEGIEFLDFTELRSLLNRKYMKGKL